MRLLITITLLVLANQSYSQESKISSLKAQLSTATDSAKVHLYCDLCYYNRFVSQDSALHYCGKAIELAKSIDYKNGIAQSYNDTGIIFLDRMDTDSALALYHKAVEIWDSLEDSARVAAVYNKIGITYQKLGKLDSAISYQFKCLEIYEQLEYDMGIAHCYNNIAIILNNQEQYKESLSYHKKSLAIRTRINHLSGIAASYVNIGNIFHGMNRYDSSVYYFKKGVPFLVKLNAKEYLGSTFNNLATSYLETSRIDSAEKYLEKSVEIRKEINDVAGLVSNQNNLGTIYYQKKQYTKSKIVLEEALENARALSMNSRLFEIHKSLMLTYEKLNDYKSALRNAQLFKQYSDSVKNENSLEVIASLKTQYETEKKEQQIALQGAEISEQEAELQRRKTLLVGSALLMVVIIALAFTQRSRLRKKQQIRLQEEKLKAREAEIKATISSQEKERARYARDLHDGFGQMISILNMNLKSLEDSAKPDERQKVFEASTKVIDDMYSELKSICFDLMPQTLIKHGLASALQEFAERVNQSGKITLELNTFGLDKRLSEVQEISIYRISQEWINNILKYSDAEKVTLQITKDEKEITILIEDDGSGFEKERLVSGKGNGWKNLNTRTNLMKGELELETEVGKKGNVLIINAPAMVTVQKEDLVLQ
ncbi:MAG: tetratricopeptide repeat protein [Ekhidna sp.]|nr:tetratricopeptide repeat protein [Ekhidna sp.]